MKKVLVIFLIVLIIGLGLAFLKSKFNITIGFGDGAEEVAEEPEVEKTVEKPVLIKELVFEKKTVYPGGHYYSVAVADFDKDGDIDIAGVDFTRKNYLFVNEGGGFVPVEEFGSGNAKVIKAADFNNDGWFDVVVGKYGPEAEVYINNKDGTFAKTLLGGHLVEDIAVADFNNDGWQDIALGVESRQNYLYLNNKDGTFDAQAQFGSGLHVRAVEACDFNNDGRVDLAVGADFQKNYLYVNRGGSFEEKRAFGEKYHTLSMACADFDSDGKPDLAVGNNNQAGNMDRNFIYYNINDLVFKASGPVIGATRSYAIETGDFDSDGSADLAVGNYNRQSYVYLNNNDGTFKEVLLPENGYVMDIDVLDMDADGDLDIVMALDTGGIAVYTNI